jgi:glycosyltransferase involved in cell wall biosynthesis
MNIELPLVSIVIITYNDANNLLEAIESSINQTYKNCEIIVIDDGSTDNTSSVVKFFSNTIKYIYQKNGGIGAARSNGFENANGKYIQFLDSDDILPIDKLEWQVEYLENNNGYAFVYGKTMCFSDSKKMNLSWEHPNSSKSRSGNLLDQIIKGGNFINIGQPLFNKEWLDKIGSCDNQIKGSDDQDLMIRLAISGAFAAYIDKISYFYRHIVDNNTFVARHNSVHRYEGEYRAWSKFYKAELNSCQKRMVDKRIASICFNLSWAFFKDSHKDSALKFIILAIKVNKFSIKCLILFVLMNVVTYNKIKIFIK